MIRQFFSHGYWKPTSSEFLFALGCLSKDEQEAAMRFRYQRDTMSSIVGKLLIRSNIVNQLHISPSEIELDRSIKGRPFLRNHQKQFDFNISHGGDHTVFVSTVTGRCGVDVMRVDLPPVQETVIHFIQKLTNIFTPNELKTILSHKEDKEKMCCFYRHWCLKEAYLKALGCGLSVPLNTIECKLGGVERAFVRQQHESVEHWTFEEHELPDNHIAAVSWYGSSTLTFPLDKPFQKLSFESLISNLTILNPVDESTWMSFIEKPYSPPSGRRKLSNDNTCVIESTCS